MKKYKALINITLRKGILDVQGKAVENALHSIEFQMITGVRIGKHVELDIDADNETKAKEIVTDACKQLIANPIIEDFVIEITEN
ncbi:MAG: phosphoribosylformylglycinamidine synthase subunit PurS [FCB group bacterium]|jgi:phosphoribosylformylglycinamidine synthase